MSNQITFSNISGCLSAADGTKGVHSQMLKNPESYFILKIQNRGGNCVNEEIAFTTEMTPKIDTGGVVLSLRSRDYKDPQYVVQGFDAYNLNQTGDIGRCLTTSSGGLNEHIPTIIENKQSVYDPSVHHGYKQFDNVCETVRARYGTGGNCTPYVVNKGDDNMSKAVVRRLTPLECTRLQGLPDDWVDIGDWVDENGKKHKDSDAPKYKALGNGIALPYWQFLANRMVDQLKKDGVEQPTMASLFDGIGSFPLVYKRAGCEPLWASEIENFCIAVCRKHFGDDELGIEGDIDKYV